MLARPPWPRFKARGAGDSRRKCASSNRKVCRPLPRANYCFWPVTWGFASLNPRLYAVACSARLNARARIISLTP